MNILLSILVIIVALVVFVLLAAIIAKKDYSIERSVTIKAPKQQVFDYLKQLRNQDQFNKWVTMDPDMKKEFRGTDGTVGFVYAWDGNKKAGKGEQELKGMKDGERLDIEVRFERPFKSVAQTPFVIEDTSEGHTKVTWSSMSKLDYPMNAMLLFMNMDKMLGKDMEDSLNNLKNRFEKK